MRAEPRSVAATLRHTLRRLLRGCLLLRLLSVTAGLLAGWLRCRLLGRHRLLIAGLRHRLLIRTLLRSLLLWSLLLVLRLWRRGSVRVLLLLLRRLLLVLLRLLLLSRWLLLVRLRLLLIATRLLLRRLLSILLRLLLRRLRLLLVAAGLLHRCLLRLLVLLRLLLRRLLLIAALLRRLLWRLLRGLLAGRNVLPLQRGRLRRLLWLLREVRLCARPRQAIGRHHGRLRQRAVGGHVLDGRAIVVAFAALLGLGLAVDVLALQLLSALKMRPAQSVGIRRQLLVGNLDRLLVLVLHVDAVENLLALQWPLGNDQGDIRAHAAALGCGGFDLLDEERIVGIRDRLTAFLFKGLFGRDVLRDVEVQHYWLHCITHCWYPKILLRM